MDGKVLTVRATAPKGSDVDALVEAHNQLVADFNALIDRFNAHTHAANQAEEYVPGAETSGPIPEAAHTSAPTIKVV